MIFNIFKRKKTIPKETQIVQTSYDYDDVSIVADYFKNITGVTFDKQASVLKNKVTTFCRLRSINSFMELISLVKNDTLLKQELIDYLTTNETFFYREFKQIHELTNLVKSLNGKVDILCAPSATGEEPYSIAIALLEAGVSRDRFHIVGIDINSEAIDKAKKGRYRERNIRNLSQQIVHRYFTKDDDHYILSANLKSKVDFKVMNIFDSSFEHIGRFDFIFSRNMLIYFDKETKLKAKEILEGLRKDKNQEVFFGHADLF